LIARQLASKFSPNASNASNRVSREAVSFGRAAMGRLVQRLIGGAYGDRTTEA
jgi:hypothetical protein